MNVVSPEKSIEERKEEITEIIKLVDSWLTDVKFLYCQTYDKINFLSTKIDSKECLKLLAEINSNTVAVYDLYTTALQLIIDINHNKLSQMVNMMQGGKSK